MDVLLPFERLRKWGMKGGLAILDQGVFSGANFLLTILLARWLVPDQYGAYAIGFSALVFFLQLLFSFVLEPMAVLGPSSHGEDLSDYLSAQVRLYFIFIGVLGLIIASTVFIYGLIGQNSLLSSVLVVLGLVLPFLLFPWLMRRIFYVLGKPEISLAGSIVYLLILLLFVVSAKQVEVLTGASSVLIVASAGLLSGLFLVLFFRRNYGYGKKITVGKLFRENWVFGKWLVLSGILMIAAGQVQIYLAGTILGLEEAGVIYALQTLSQPITLSITAVTAVITPSLAADFARGDIDSLKKKVKLMTIVLAGLAMLFEVFLFFFRVPLEQIVFDGIFSNHVDLIPILGLCPLVASLFSGMQYALQAAKRPDALLFASLIWFPVSLGLGLFFIRSWGLWGGAWATVLGYLVLGVALAFLYWLWLVKRPNLKRPGAV